MVLFSTPTPTHQYEWLFKREFYLYSTRQFFVHTLQKRVDLVTLVYHKDMLILCSKQDWIQLIILFVYYIVRNVLGERKVQI